MAKGSYIKTDLIGRVVSEMERRAVDMCACRVDRRGCLAPHRRPSRRRRRPDRLIFF